MYKKLKYDGLILEQWCYVLHRRRNLESDKSEQTLQRLLLKPSTVKKLGWGEGGYVKRKDKKAFTWTQECKLAASSH